MGFDDAPILGVRPALAALVCARRGCGDPLPWGVRTCLWLITTLDHLEGSPKFPAPHARRRRLVTPEAALATPPYILAHPFEFQAPSATCTKAATPEGEDSRFVERLLREGMDKVTSQQEADFQDLAKQDTDSFFAFLK